MVGPVFFQFHSSSLPGVAEMVAVGFVGVGELVVLVVVVTPRRLSLFFS